jgi:hypothetical protein
MVSCGPDGGLGPIMAFEFARTPADIVGCSAASPAPPHWWRRRRPGLLLDALGFIPFYTAFLILAVIAAGRARRVNARADRMLLVAALSDQIEGG